MSRPLDPRLLRAVPGLRRYVVALGLLHVIGAVLLVLQASAVGLLVTGVFLRHRDAGQLVTTAVALGLFVAGRAAVAAVQEWVAARTSVRVRGELRAAVLGAVRRLGPGWVARQPSGHLATVAGSGMDDLDGWITRALPALVAAAVVPPIVLARVAWLDWQSALILIITVPLVPVFMALIGIVTHRHMQRQYAALARMSGQFLDLVAGLTSLRVYGQVHRSIDTVRASTERYRRRSMSTLRIAFLSGLVLDLIAALAIALVAVAIGLRLDHGQVGLGVALVVLLLAPDFFAPLRAVGALHHANEQGRVAGAAAVDVIDAAAQFDTTAQLADTAQLDTTAHRGDTVPAGGGVTLRGVSVRYAERDAAALDGCTLDVPAGEVVALRGRSGAGKSTVLAVLLGFVTPASGDVRVPGDPTPWADRDADAWRRRTAWVPQRPQLTQPDVGSEVALGEPLASTAEIDAAIAACAAPPAHTALGENGRRVSAGQRRRIALARALLRARRCIQDGTVPLVLLDEPSEDLDAANEDVVARVITELRGRATVLFATHSDRLAAVADRTVELHGGTVIRDVRQAPVAPPQRATALATPAPAAASATPSDRGTDAVTQRELLRHLLRGPGTVTAARRLVGAALLSGAAGLSALALTATSLWLICRASQHPNVQALEVAVVGVRTFALSRALLRYLERLVSHDAALRLLASLRGGVFASIAPRVPGALDLRRGDLLRRFVGDVDGLQEGLIRAVVPTAGAAITAVGACAVAAALAPMAALVLLIGVVVAGVVAPWLSRAASGRAHQLTALAGDRDTQVIALLDAMPELVAYGALDRQLAAIADIDGRFARAARPAAVGAALGVALAGCALAVTFPIVMLAGAAAVHSGTLAPVAVGVLIACVLGAFEAAAGLPAAFAAWGRCRAGLQRVAGLVGAPTLPDPVRPQPVPSGHTGVRLRDAGVAPAPGLAAVVGDVELELPAGHRVLITGPSGSGKSTVLGAIMRLNPVTTGSVALVGDHGDAEVRDIRADDMPPIAAGSLQGDHVFDATLRDNLRVVRPDADDADLEAVAARVGLAGFVATLPGGWGTAAGSDGAALSGGQRQRLLLARALLADPRVLVLDEPTAHLDPDTEREVLADLLSATATHTLVMTSHRALEPVADAFAGHLAISESGQGSTPTTNGSGRPTVT